MDATCTEESTIMNVLKYVQIDILMDVCTKICTNGCTEICNNHVLISATTIIYYS